MSQSPSEAFKVETAAVSVAVVVKEALNTPFPKCGRQSYEPLSETSEFPFPNKLYQIINRDIAIAVGIQMMHNNCDLTVVQVHIQRAQSKL
jgi:hypothetical protein